MIDEKITEKKEKRKKSEPYFTQETENAIVLYLKTESPYERERIYNNYIHRPFYKLVENIIHSFKLSSYSSVDKLSDLKYEVISFLLQKLPRYNQENGKAYSYFGTIAKRYLIIENKKNYSSIKKNTNLSEVDNDKIILEDLLNRPDISDYIDGTSFIDTFITYVEDNYTSYFKKTNDIKVCFAVLELFRKRENIEIFNKKAIYLYIKEITDCNTTQVTRAIKKLKLLYVVIYNQYLQDGFLDKNKIYEL
jgi:hypothetical protein